MVSISFLTIHTHTHTHKQTNKQTKQKKFEAWEEANKNIPEEDRTPFKRSHYIMYDISPLDIHGYFDKVVIETAPGGKVAPEMIISQGEDVEMLEG